MLGVETLWLTVKKKYVLIIHQSLHNPLLINLNMIIKKKLPRWCKNLLNII